MRQLLRICINPRNSSCNLIIQVQGLNCEKSNGGSVLHVYVCTVACNSSLGVSTPQSRGEFCTLSHCTRASQHTHQLHCLLVPSLPAHTPHTQDTTGDPSYNTTGGGEGEVSHQKYVRSYVINLQLNVLTENRHFYKTYCVLKVSTQQCTATIHIYTSTHCGPLLILVIIVFT